MTNSQPLVLVVNVVTFQTQLQGEMCCVIGPPDLHHQYLCPDLIKQTSSKVDNSVTLYTKHQSYWLAETGLALWMIVNLLAWPGLGRAGNIINSKYQ